MKEVKFLGHIISQEGTVVDSAKTHMVQNWNRPTNASELRSFLGLTWYYQRFVKSFSKIASPLTGLKKKETKFKLKDRHEHTHQELKAKLTLALVFVIPKSVVRDSPSTMTLQNKG